CGASPHQSPVTSYLIVVQSLQQDPGMETSSILLTLSAADYQSVPLEQITTHLGREPGVRSVSWKLDPMSLGD
ncbi:MAG TPA: hypothetical protein VF020_16470, partial [Chthoniobacterales bacterium]